MCLMTAYQVNIFIFCFYKNMFTTFIIMYEALRSFIFRECMSKVAKIPQKLVKLSEIWRFLAFDDSTNKPKLFVPYGRNTSFIIIFLSFLKYFKKNFESAKLCILHRKLCKILWKWCKMTNWASFDAVLARFVLEWKIVKN